MLNDSATNKANKKFDMIKHAVNYFYVDTLKSLYKSTVI